MLLFSSLLSIFFVVTASERAQRNLGDRRGMGITVESSGKDEAAGLVVSFGEMLIDFVPDVAGVSLAESKGFLKAPGGAPANVAVAISKLGGHSAFIGKVLSLSLLDRERTRRFSNGSDLCGSDLEIRYGSIGVITRSIGF